MLEKNFSTHSGIGKIEKIGRVTPFCKPTIASETSAMILPELSLKLYSLSPVFFFASDVSTKRKTPWPKDKIKASQNPFLIHYQEVKIQDLLPQ